MKIGFHTNRLSLRGTEIAVYDYALHNQELLRNESVIFYRKQNPAIDSIIEKFSKHFKLLPYDGNRELNQLIEREKIDATYFIKSGERDDVICTSAPSWIHAVFPTSITEFHGDKYAFVSEWLARECSNSRIPFVPHMISLPEHTSDLRASLGIPQDATVIGSYGGADSFNLGFAQAEVLRALKQRNDLYFLFMNIDSFAAHERLIFLPGSADLDYKVQFINTCDGMIHARGIGESFGLACGEFSIKGKPVITYSMSPQRSHIEILGDKAFLYKGGRELADILMHFDRSVQQQRNWDAYSSQFSPVAVMRRFKSTFIDGKNRADIQLSTLDRLAVQAYRVKCKWRNLEKKLYL
jgi:hypothetical protein